MNKAYIALGSNIQPRLHYLHQAIDILSDHPNVEVLKQSSIYETEPVGYTEQGQFLNMVLEIITDLEPHLLLDVCQAIERKLGRKRDIRWGPRTIDLDVLDYNQENIETERLRLPHPRLHERAFVLIPLAELSEQLYITDQQCNVSELLKHIPAQDKKGGVNRWKQTIGGVNESKPFGS
ncbi:2-amino-4-hydroxy-6-hydroxymethyldihydropteridine pyrophosphokinase [Gracilibacillus boraciitolerans JCM 21714]|uniref:2-amino-4-hydroxy-6-hydroxymethyldihydropteridine diphosphokinase n=1 Tax=Gracilibacillus boraciitolerans JCM 21714 TaxID=1298598 RepID=W4VM25_9BACI|nr:2-amino-4-hydroxy-6-hydroxymethyldihydropteridine diphosphokinase [Gracilibacillus boraciitolerans]GAE94226.1 2-amino-4-hydroxy-6-hydroxymethyldihydropteridine pyrophosphokinase [Gracilibacillus boraciitolerans JCM 21714]